MERIMDVLMCVLWIMTYTLVLVGTLKYKYPIISPITQAIIAPLEFSVLILFFKLRTFRLEYASIAYLYWAVIEIAIIIVMIRKEHIRKRHAVPYSIIVLLITAVMIWLVAIREEMFFFTYANTFVGVTAWLVYVILKKDYPIQPITLAVFTLKLFADILGVPVYYGEGNWVTDFFCIGLPSVDFLFILIYIYRKKNIRENART